MGAGLQRAFAAARATRDNPLAGCGKIQRAAFEALALGLEPRMADATKRALLRKGVIVEGPPRSVAATRWARSGCRLTLCRSRFMPGGANGATRGRPHDRGRANLDAGRPDGAVRADAGRAARVPNCGKGNMMVNLLARQIATLVLRDAVRLTDIEMRRAPVSVPAVAPKPTPQPRAYLSGSRLYKPNGARECARRQRQVAAGSLRAENGLR